MDNNLEYLRIYKENNKLYNLEKHVLEVDNDTDIVIDGLGFIKIKKQSTIIIYTIQNVRVYTRKSLI